VPRAPAAPAAPETARAAGGRWPWVAAASLILATTAGLAWVALRAHPIGDYFTESDFYEYARGAEALRHGTFDPARYGTIGPVYELALAAAGLVTAHVFRFATLFSALAAGAVLACWFAIAARRAGPVAGLWAAALLAANPVFFRYGYSATTDLPALAMQAFAAAALFAGRRPRPLAAGLAAGLAILTRYTSAFLVPLALVVLAARGGGRRGRLLAYALGLALSLGPWTLYSLSRGHVPGEGLVRNRAFYASDSATRNRQDLPSDATVPAAAGEPLPRVLARRVAEHAARDAKELLGWPCAALAAAGLVLALRPRAWGATGAWPVALYGGGGFVMLLAGFYSDRYSLTIAPAYTAAAGLALAALHEGRRLRPAGAVLATLVALAVVGDSARRSRDLQVFVRSQLPVEALAAADYVRGLHREDVGVLARKAAVPHFSGARYVPFPKVRDLAQLARAARDARATHVYFSWYEGELRPEFWYLLDSTSHVPGLRPVFTTAHNPSILYEIAPGFGAAPAWDADTTERRIHELRGCVRVLGEAESYDAQRRLGIHAAHRMDWGPALDHFGAMTRGRPSRSEGWTLGGYALLGRGQPDQARAWFARALALDAGDALARAGLGLADWRLGRAEAAAAELRPEIARVRDAAVLRGLAAWYGAHADPGAAADCARQLAALGAR
jgi:hypothetical protein